VPMHIGTTYNQAFTVAETVRKKLIRDQLAALGIKAEPRRLDPDVYRCGHYCLWNVGHWRIALWHPLHQVYCNQVVYGENLRAALTILLDLQNQPLLPPDEVVTLIWEQAGTGDIANYQHFKNRAAAQKALDNLTEEGNLKPGSKPLIAPYEVPYRLGSDGAVTWYIQGRPVKRTIGIERTHHQFVWQEK